MNTNRFKQLLESTMGNVKPLIMEQVVEGPLGVPPIQYYVYNVNGKFYIYQTNASQKTPTLPSGTIYNNSGQGYNTQNDAKAVILNIIKDSKPIDHDEEMV